MYEKYVLLRNRKGVTDYRVSKETGIPKSTFSEWKSGRSKPKVDKLKILADYFAVSIEYFLFLKEPELREPENSIQPEPECSPAVNLISTNDCEEYKVLPEEEKGE